MTASNDNPFPFQSHKIFPHTRFFSRSLFIGGGTSGQSALSSVELYQLGDSTSTMLPPMTQPRVQHGCTSFTNDNGDISLIVTGGTREFEFVGGVDVCLDPLSSVETIHKSASGWGSWNKVSNLKGGWRVSHKMVNIGRFLYITGGSTSSLEAEDSILESVDDGTTWTESTARLTIGRNEHTALWYSE